MTSQLCTCGHSAKVHAAMTLCVAYNATSTQTTQCTCESFTAATPALLPLTCPYCGAVLSIHIAFSEFDEVACMCGATWDEDCDPVKGPRQ